MTTRLIGYDEATGDVVVVEKQLEQPHHTHLGQVITYAPGPTHSDLCEPNPRL